MPYISIDGWQFPLPPFSYILQFECRYCGRMETIMIEVTRLNDSKLIINADLIEKIEESPDTIITLNNGNKIIVKESRQEIKNLVILYKKEVFGRSI